MNAALGFSREDYHCAVAKSMLVSCDNAHALHPNRPEVADAENRPVLGGGMVVKEAANQKYCTDAFSRAAFLSVCEAAGVPVQRSLPLSMTATRDAKPNASSKRCSVRMIVVPSSRLILPSVAKKSDAAIGSS